MTESHLFSKNNLHICKTIKDIMKEFHLKHQTKRYQGKVRDVYTINDNILVLIATNRISAFDVILPRPIPGKGQILNQIAAYMLQHTADICPNWLRGVPAPNVSVGVQAEPYKVEMVVRGNLTGHSWRTYRSGKRILCGVPLPDGMKENDFFPSPIITPSTKAEQGHDEDISRDDILSTKLVDPSDYEQLETYSLQLFERGKQMAGERGLILADTKYEFGKRDGQIMLIDEIHTPDSSRYFYSRDFDQNQLAGEKQKQLSKEFVREWLISEGFMGKEGQQIPEMTDEWICTIQSRYTELYETLIGKKLTLMELSDDELEKRINDFVEGMGDER